MKKKIRIVGFVLAALLLLMQFYQPARNADNGQVRPIDFIKMCQAPDSVQTILKKACYDCHSGNTRYPWYSYVQPVRFMMENHISNGKANLNFSEFGNYPKRRQISKLRSMEQTIKNGDMPLASYTWIHRDAVLSKAEKTMMFDWIDHILNSLE